MKKLNVVLILLVALTFVLPASLTFAAQKSSVSQEQVAVGKININTAGAEALVNIPGIGPKTAEKIVQHRTANGNFTSLDDLASVRGIGEKSLKKMKPYLTF
ncbi:MAG: helix-hairpin-helix domain-containing protein [Desulfopila sp.]|jgi:competence protein ComEA|nr:helix-hairpin-helix domain-containing protein [Desulfopila sp.]